MDLLKLQIEILARLVTPVAQDVQWRDDHYPVVACDLTRIFKANVRFAKASIRPDLEAFCFECRTGEERLIVEEVGSEREIVRDAGAIFNTQQMREPGWRGDDVAIILPVVLDALFRQPFAPQEQIIGGQIKLSTELHP